jgi:CRISPR-associated protein Csm3
MRPFATFRQERPPLSSHEDAVSRYRFSGMLHLNAPLHVGSGQSDLRTDSAVVKDHRGRPIVPGSSLRGALRSRCERLADALIPGQVCFLYDNEASDVDCVSIATPETDPMRVGGDLLSDEEIWRRLPRHLCASCRLFGSSAYWASKVRIPDLPLIEPDRDAVTQIRHGVGIHRDTGSAAPAIKYDQEIVTADAVFALEILVENPDPDDLALLALGLAELHHGHLTLGGNSSRGLGGCRLEESVVDWVNLQDRQQLVDYLVNGEYPAANHQNLALWLDSQLNRWRQGA